MTVIRGYIRYFKYVLTHKYYVAKACFSVGLYRQGLVHDLSKFLPSEARRYMRYYSLGDKTIQRQFDFAWNYHQKRNKHHWQYWVLLEDSGSVKAMEMPMNYALEMVCDWRGVGKTFNPSDTRYEKDYRRETREWYIKNKDKMILHESTRLYVEYILAEEVDLGVIEF